jgi:hypothetical protein
MHRRPLAYQRERAVRQAAGIHGQRLDLDQGFVLPERRVKMVLAVIDDLRQSTSANGGSA